MERKIQQVNWTLQASEALENIFEFYADKSIQGAINVVNEIIEKTNSIRYPDQYQMDEFNPAYRRLIVRDYKVLYFTIETTVFIIHVVSTRKAPEIVP